MNNRDVEAAIDYHQSTKLAYINLANKPPLYKTYSGLPEIPLPSDFNRIIRLIEEGTINTVPWITHRTSFDDVIGEFETFTKPESGVIKAIVELV